MAPHEIHPFGFLHELEHIPRRTATKALVATGFVAHIKRRGLFAMKWAKTQKIATRPLERDIVANDRRNWLRHAHPLYVVVCDGHARDTSWGVYLPADFAPPITACAAAKRAIGTRYGEQLT